jgi:signal peptidase II
LTRLRLSAYAIAVLTAAANFLFAQYILGLGAVATVLIPGLADFSPTLNRGVSFGLLTQDTLTGTHWLIILLMVISVFVAGLAWRAATFPAAIGFGLILGGALGNLVDRLTNNGAVFDYLALHLGKMPLFVCNFADMLITAGVVVLIAETLLANQGARDFAG